MQESGFDKVHQALVAHPPVSSKTLAHRLGLDDSTVSRYLHALADSGLARRVKKGRQVFYWPMRSTYVSHVAPLLDERSDREPPWVHWQWRSFARVDWRFPLVSRIADEPGQQAASALLRACDREGLFHPWITGRPIIEEWLMQQPEDLHAGIRRRIREAEDVWGDFSFVVFGSCARGDAREDSDLDLFVIGPNEDAWGPMFNTDYPAPPWPSWEETLYRILDQVNIGSPRHIETFLVQRDHETTLPPALYDAIINEGKTIFTSLGSRFEIETRRAIGRER